MNAEQVVIAKIRHIMEDSISSRERGCADEVDFLNDIEEVLCHYFDLKCLEASPEEEEETQ